MVSNHDLEQSLEKNVKVANSLNNSSNNPEEMNIYLGDKNHKSKKKYKYYKRLTSTLQSVDTVASMGATKTPVTLLVTGVGLIVLPISAGYACVLSLGNRVKRKIIKKTGNSLKKYLKKAYKQLTPPLNYAKKVWKFFYLTKVNIDISLEFLLSTLMKHILNHFPKVHIKLKF